MVHGNNYLESKNKHVFILSKTLSYKRYVYRYLKSSQMLFNTLHFDRDLYFDCFTDFCLLYD